MVGLRRAETSLDFFDGKNCYLGNGRGLAIFVLLHLLHFSLADLAGFGLLVDLTRGAFFRLCLRGVDRNGLERAISVALPFHRCSLAVRILEGFWSFDAIPK